QLDRADRADPHAGDLDLIASLEPSGIGHVDGATVLAVDVRDPVVVQRDRHERDHADRAPDADLLGITIAKPKLPTGRLERRIALLVTHRGTHTVPSSARIAEGTGPCRWPGW